MPPFTPSAYRSPRRCELLFVWVRYQRNGGGGRNELPTQVDATTWRLTAPGSVGVHRLDRSLDWAHAWATYAVLVTTDGSASTRATTSGRPRPGVSIDEAPLFGEGEHREIDSVDGDVLLARSGVDAPVFFCSGIQITASDPTAPGLARLKEEVTDEVLA